MKSYTYRVYDKTGSTLLATWGSDKVLGEPQFTSQINGGFSDTTLDIIAPFDNYNEFGTVREGNIVRIICADGSLQPTTVYVGVMSQYRPFTQGAKQGVKIDLLSPLSLLTRAHLKDSDYIVNIGSVDPADMIRYILTHFNTKYPGVITWDEDSIEDVGAVSMYSFNSMTWLECIQQAYKLTGAGWYWYIDATGTFHLHPKAESATHRFTFGKDIESHETTKSGEGIINACLVKYQVQVSEEVTEDREYYHEDVESISTYGLREVIISDSKIRSDWSAQTRAEKEVEDNKEIRTKTNLTLNSTYLLPLEQVQVGQTCKFLNYRQEDTTFNENMLIASIDYSPDSLRIQLEDVSNFGVAFLNAIKK